MFCPICRQEYREGFSRCSDCNVLLADTLPAAPDSPDAAHVAWVGNDPVEYTRVQAALNESGVEMYQQERFNLRSSWLGAKYIVYVHARDAAKAAKAINDAGVPPTGSKDPG